MADKKKDKEKTASNKALEAAIVELRERIEVIEKKLGIPYVGNTDPDDDGDVDLASDPPEIPGGGE